MESMQKNSFQKYQKSFQAFQHKEKMCPQTFGRLALLKESGLQTQTNFAHTFGSPAAVRNLELIFAGREINALAKVQFDCKFTGSIEIGWRFKPSSWGKGLASEGARKLLEYGFLSLEQTKNSNPT